MNAPTLFEALQAIPDHRTKKGRRFPLATILIISLAAMLSGATICSQSHAGDAS